MPDLFVAIDKPSSALSFVFEDDGHVAYGYLYQDAKIVADVWLYNSGGTPDEPDWDHPDKAPFRNPRRFLRPDCPFPFATAEQHVTVRWHEDERGRAGAQIFIHGVLAAEFHVGESPGRSVMALQPSPVAKPLDHQ